MYVHTYERAGLLSKQSEHALRCTRSNRLNEQTPLPRRTDAHTDVARSRDASTRANTFCYTSTWPDRFKGEQGRGGRWGGEIDYRQMQHKTRLLIGKVISKAHDLLSSASGLKRNLSHKPHCRLSSTESSIMYLCLPSTYLDISFFFLYDIENYEISSRWFTHEENVMSHRHVFVVQYIDRPIVIIFLWERTTLVLKWWVLMLLIRLELRSRGSIV